MVKHRGMSAYLEPRVVAWLMQLSVTMGCNASSELHPPRAHEVLAGLRSDAPIDVTLVTDGGSIACQIDARRTPRAVGLFVGFALGRATFLDPFTHRVTRRPLYRNLPIHRAVAGALLQTGDPKGDGTGDPGYRVEVEIAGDDRARLSKPGALVLARYTAPPGRADPRPPPPGQLLGSQFALLLIPMPHLVGLLSVIGHCDDLALAKRLSIDIAEQHIPRRLLEVRVHGAP
jgi:peptidyl-prolyl cis-trans isomerase A (cyclophilin A)